MIKLKNVSKKFSKQYVLKNIDYTFKPGEIYGLYGINGSGKTMLLRALSGLIIPSEGTIEYNDLVLHKDISFSPNTGLIIENMQLLPQYNAFDNLKILAKINKRATEEDIIDAINRVGLDPTSTKRVKKFSLGMRQRLNIAQAIFEKPDYLFLDEPTNALDEDGVSFIYEILRKEADRGATIVMASHNKEDIHELCTKVIHMKEGAMVNE